MISLDRGLLGRAGSGDVVERHRRYANLAGALDIIVFASAKYTEYHLAQNLRIFPTRSSKFSHYSKAVDLALALNKEQAYDLLVTQDFTAPAGLRIKKYLNLPWIVNIHSMFFSRRWLGFNLVSWYLLWLVKRAIKAADGFRVNNNEIRSQLASWGITEPILVQPTPIDIERFKNQGSRIKNKGERGIDVLFVGRLSPEKNVGLLIRAFKKINGGFRLIVVGQGAEATPLKRLAASDVRIEFLGQKNLEELPEIFGGADIFVLPSNTESFGQVLLQAAASGLAILSTDTPGAREILGEGESGILVPVGSEKDLERELKNLLTKTYEREYWAKKAQDMSERYDAAAGLERTMMFWREIANTPLTSPLMRGERGGSEPHEGERKERP